MVNPRSFLPTLSATIVALVGCGPMDGAGDAGTAGPTDAAMEEVDAGPPDLDTPLGGDRPAEFLAPQGWDGTETLPLILLLHGYQHWASGVSSYFGTGELVDELGFVLVLPDGLTDSQGNQFWNATDVCCDFDSTNSDDVGYLTGLLVEAKQRFAIDEDRVFVMGHSNGGFMAHRLACESSEHVAGIFSFAGSNWDDETLCAPDQAVSVIQLHGTADGTIEYNGDPGGFSGFGPGYPGATEVMSSWANRNGCSSSPSPGRDYDLVTTLAGDDTSVQSWSGCDDDVSVELWTIDQGSHAPNWTPQFNDIATSALLDLGR